MERDTTGLTDMRRRALDRLLVQYLELDQERRKTFMERCRSRYPRLSRWLPDLVDSSETISLLDRPLDALVGDALGNRSRQETTGLTPGRRLGPWEVTEQVGEGGMGMVYRGRRGDGAFEMDVAIKLLRLRRSGLGEQLQRESRLLARLDHESVTRLLDAGLDEEGGPFLVMEWIEGEDLADWRGRSPGLEPSLDVIEQLAGALGHAHQRLIVHGDIKPGNVRVRDNGQVKLLDFGIARLLAEGDVLESGLAALTPAFAAPEQRAGQPPTTRSDVWSLGALLGWLLLGESPGSMDAATRSMQIRQHYPRGHELAGIVDMACAEDPDWRYGSVGELAADIHAYRNHLPLQALNPGPLGRARKFARRNRVLVGATMAVFAVLLVGMATTTGMYLQAQQEAERAMAANERTEAVKGFLIDMISEADHWTNPGEMPTVRDVLDRSRPAIEREFADQPDIAAELLGVVGASYIGLEERDTAREVLAAAMNIVEAGTVPELPPETIAGIRYEYAAVADVDRATRMEKARALLADMGSDPRMHEHRSELKTYLAYAQLMEGDAERALEKARAAAELVCYGEVEIEPCVTVLNNKMYFYSHLDMRDEGLEAAARAWELAMEEYPDTAHPLHLRAGTGYGEALARNDRPEEAIELLVMLREMVGGIYGVDSLSVALVDLRLAQSYWLAGRTHRGWPLLTEALDTIALHDPGAASIPVQLNFVPRMLFELYKLDKAEEIMTRYDDVMPDDPPRHSISQALVNQVHLAALRDPGNPEIEGEIRALADEMEELDPPVVGRLMQVGLLQAIAAGDRDSARDWLEAVEAAWSSHVSHEWVGLARARLALLEQQPERALEHAADARDRLMDRQETTGPVLARARAVMAEAHCRQGDNARGQELLEQARRYWRVDAEVEAGDRAMLELATSCIGTAARRANGHGPD